MPTALGPIILRKGTPPTPPTGYVALYSADGGAAAMVNDQGVVTLLGANEAPAFTSSGTLVVKTGASRYPIGAGTWTITEVRATVGTAPAGASVIVDVKKNGTTVYGTAANRPTIAAGSNAAVGGTPSVTTFTAGDYITVDIAQVGSTTAGSDLTVVVRLSRTA